MKFDIFQYDRPQLLMGEAALNFLSEDEKQRAASFSLEQGRLWYQACRAQLRQVLAQYLQCAPKDIQLSYNAAGKPALAAIHQSSLQFNLSHTKEKLLIAVHPCQQIGVDIEEVESRDHLALAERFFCHQEFLDLAALPPKQQTLAFYRLWVCKEALAKAVGVGIYEVLNQVQFTGFVDGSNATIVNPDYQAVSLTLLAIDQKHCAAVAICP